MSSWKHKFCEVFFEIKIIFSRDHYCDKPFFLCSRTTEISFSKAPLSKTPVRRILQDLGLSRFTAALQAQERRRTNIVIEDEVVNSSGLKTKWLEAAPALERLRSRRNTLSGRFMKLSASIPSTLSPPQPPATLTLAEPALLAGAAATPSSSGSRRSREGYRGSPVADEEEDDSDSVSMGSSSEATARSSSRRSKEEPELVATTRSDHLLRLEEALFEVRRRLGV